MAIVISIVIFILLVKIFLSKPSYHKVLEEAGRYYPLLLLHIDEVHQKLNDCYKKNANIEELDKNAETPLMVAISCSAFDVGYKECVKLLLKYGANPNPPITPLGVTPLMKAVTFRSVIAAAFIHSCLHNIDTLNYKKAPTFIPTNNTEETSAEIVKILIENNANINVQNMTGQTALHLAAGAGNLDAIEVLLSCEGIDPQIKNENGETALDIFEAVQNDPENKSGAIFTNPVKIIPNFKENKTYKLLKEMTEGSRHKTSRRNK